MTRMSAYCLDNHLMSQENNNDTSTSDKERGDTTRTSPQPHEVRGWWGGTDGGRGILDRECYEQKYPTLRDFG